ncbi:MAG: cupin domain-containing protein [Deltaproteobacteria bacterium]|nr:MAG: cupin domain-containing protein [Deltaproteobacteria bacterium]
MAVKETFVNEKKKGARIPGGEPKVLSELVGYQEDSIVSRILLQDEAGTVTVFAFDEGQALSEHTVPFNAFIQVLDGMAEVIIGGKASNVKTGEIILMPGNVPHRVNAPQNFKMLLTMIKTPV